MTPDMKRLYKSRTDRMIDGICGGIAEYFGLDSTLVRIAWVLLIFFGGAGILLYIAAMIIMPVNLVSISATGPVAKRPSSGANQKFWGILFLAVGIAWLMGNLGLPFWHHWWGFSFGLILPVVLILAGVAFLFGGRDYIISPSTPAQPVGEPSSQQGATPEPSVTRARRLYRSRFERKLFGVCGGLGDYFDVDPTIVRILFVISALASFGLTILLYIAMAIIVPEEPLVSPAS
jgi:phage shock protein C